MKSLSLLFKLQQIDSRIVSLNKTSKDLKISFAKQIKLEKMQKSQLISLQNDRDEKEIELKKLEKSLKEIDSKTYGGTVKSGKELTALINESDHLKKNIEELEETLLKIIDGIEELEVKEQQLTGDSELPSDIKSSLELTKIYRTVVKEIESITKSREIQVKKIPETMLRKYDAIRKSHNGIGITKIVDSSCGVCNMKIPKGNMFKVTARADGTQCSSCGIILFAE